MKAVLAIPDIRAFQAALARAVQGTNPKRIRKLEIAKSGELLAELRAGPRPLWVRWDGEHIEELNPANDERLALSALLRDRKSDTAFEILNYRPGRRLVLLDRRSRKPVVIKGYRRGRAAAAFSRYEAAHRALVGHGIRAPEVLDQDEAMDSIMLLYEEGGSLEITPDTMHVFHRVGEGLASFQACSPDIEIRRFNSGDELAVIDRFVSKTTHMGMDLPHGWEIARARLGAASETLPFTEFGLCHRDLHDRQFVFNGTYLVLLDFDLLCRADIALDPANFLAHLVLRDFQARPGATRTRMDECAQRFLDGIARTPTRSFWKRLRFYQASSFCRLALVYTLRPRWSGLAPKLTRMAERCLDDLQRV